MKKAHIVLVDKCALYCGGGSGIRTHVGASPNGFQDRLVMTTSISLRRYDALQCIISTENPRAAARRTSFVESTSHTPLEDRQACLSDTERGYPRRQARYPFDAYSAYLNFESLHFSASYLRRTQEMRLGELCSSNPLRIPRSKIDKLACRDLGVGILAVRRDIRLMHTVHIFIFCANLLISRSVIISQKNAFVK